MTAQSFPPAIFQSFEEKSDKKTVAPRIAALRAAMTAEDPFLSEIAHQAL